MGFVAIAAFAVPRAAWGADVVTGPLEEGLRTTPYLGGHRLRVG